jgi:hypothetical protein
MPSPAGSAPPLRREKEANEQGGSPSADAIGNQVKRVLADPLFTNSKRYPVLLAYVVEQTLLGNAALLKERTIGVEAFGRPPDYDVNIDAVVRTTAAEVRKRLTQYYHDPKHAGEPVIELPTGSYVPKFLDHVEYPDPLEPAAFQSYSVGSHPVTPAAATPIESNAMPIPWLRAAVFLGSIALATSVGFFLGLRQSHGSSEVSRFWAPMTATENRVSYCLGAPATAVDRQRLELQGKHLVEGLDETDVATLGRFIAQPVSNNQPFRIVSASDVPFAQLREGPIVLIGAYDNTWTMRIAANLPIGFDFNAEGRALVDRHAVPTRSWTTRLDPQQSKRVEDYAIIARIHDELTGQPVIVVGGIHSEGTEAAGEAITDPSYLRLLLKDAPQDWEKKNFEAVIRTNVIDGHAGPPIVVTTTSW